MTAHYTVMTSLRRSVFILLLCSALWLPFSGFAHEVLPEVYLEFVRENPNYSDEEFEQFLVAHPELRTDQDFLDHVIETKREPASWFHNARDFVRLGIIHILEGTDHVLFVLSLLLIYTSFKREVLLLTVFTIAHSVSLLLAGSGILTLSSRVVEPIVALSITYMAITSVFFKHIKAFGSHANKASTVFLFGLFHGLGFAGLLKDIRVPDERFISSLLSFNIGIELGQLAIVAVALPFIYLFKDKLWYPKAIKVIAVLIATVGLFWGFERIFL